MEQIKQDRSRFFGFLRSSQTRACLLATAVFGALSYLYLFVNNINNNDMIVCLPEGYGTGLTSGRWALYFLGEVTRRVWGVYNVPFSTAFSLCSCWRFPPAYWCACWSCGATCSASPLPQLPRSSRRSDR